MKQILITGYEFTDFLDDENNILYEWKDAANKIIQDEIDLQMSFNDDRFKDVMDECERLKTPWFINQGIWDGYKDKIIQDILKDNYLYDENGNILGRVEEFDDIGM